jgi:Cof subfamily protein (haloacid dehalogenase superfamily)
MKYSLLAADLDGTLFNDKKEIDVETINSIHEFREKGGRVVICSGRSPLSASWIAETIGLAGEPIVAFNGAIILDENRQMIHQAAFKHETILSFLEICEAEGIYTHLYEGDNLLIPIENKWNHNWIENNIPALETTGGKPEKCEGYRQKCNVKHIGNFYHYLKTRLPVITKMAVFHEEGRLYNFSKRINKEVGDLEISSSLNYLNLEISPSGVTKASALQKVCNYLDIPLSTTAAIGDNYNDSRMLQISGLGIAMGNAPEEVKSAANVVTARNNQLGVAAAIQQYLLS